ncbi:MAG: Ada metal-binding domain-containing protein, partial [Geminicoccaceae bacterium]
MNAAEPARERAFATDEARREAVRSRDATADGSFVYAVATTGVY